MFKTPTHNCCATKTPTRNCCTKTHSHTLNQQNTRTPNCGATKNTHTIVVLKRTQLLHKFFMASKCSFALQNCNIAKSGQLKLNQRSVVWRGCIYGDFVQVAWRIVGIALGACIGIPSSTSFIHKQNVALSRGGIGKPHTNISQKHTHTPATNQTHTLLLHKISVHNTHTQLLRISPKTSTLNCCTKTYSHVFN